MTFCSFLFEEKPNSKESGRDSFENTIPSRRRRKSKRDIVSEKEKKNYRINIFFDIIHLDLFTLYFKNREKERN